MRISYKLGKEEKMRKIRIGAIVFAFIMCLGMAQSVMAQGKNLEILEMLKTEERIEARKKPSDTAEVLKVYEPGDIILIVEGGNAEWDAVAYQGNVYYVKKSEEVTTIPTARIEAEDTVTEKKMDQTYQEELAAQMETQRHEGKVFVEEYERYQKERRQKRIWGAVIGVLMIGILGVSVYSHFSEKRTKRK